ncbi:ankyrin repeat-containing protein NPR4-like [Telopea speciosissima]|uniref:ankyrin repeat-containing protein NPR4-like n=1 Tax=Telopea speciosissima TaxID=54955 RepID=UPI001CC7719E|nr:ankyrin repeat-containing protein NPR4-like [Telopea speciosissima]
MDNLENNILHLAGKSPPSSHEHGKVPGAALQMQRELQWFQEVEKIVPTFAREFPNSKGLKPREVFTEEHTKIVKEGEKWMKDTAGSCMVVATLIATITFAAAFTVPGGFNQDSGFPILLKQKLFFLFIISDALTLFSSSTSVLMFLSIYTSRYAEEDFLELLPKRLIIGLSTLFFSIVTMMVAFCATIFLILSKQHNWVSIPITFLASVPVTLYLLLQFPLFLDMVSSTYGHGLFSTS